MQLLYPKDPNMWLTYICLPGKTEEWIRNDMKPGRPEYLSDEVRDSLRYKRLLIQHP